jgi:phage FluMu protein Com
VNEKIRCTECGWHGTTEDTLVGESPFEHGVNVYGCPRCKEIDHFRAVCDEVGCWKLVSCGCPSPAGYRNTCSEHMPEDMRQSR